MGGGLHVNYYFACRKNVHQNMNSVLTNGVIFSKMLMVVFNVHIHWRLQVYSTVYRWAFFCECVKLLLCVSFHSMLLSMFYYVYWTLYINLVQSLFSFLVGHVHSSPFSLCMYACMRVCVGVSGLPAVCHTEIEIVHCAHLTLHLIFI